MTQQHHAGYIYVTGWDKFQHYHDRHMIWMKVYADLLDNDAFRDLSNADRGLLLGIWLCTVRTGNGRTSANVRQLSDQLGTRVRQLEPLIHAGFITVRASKAKPRASSFARQEEKGSKEPSKKKKRDALAAQPPARQEPHQNGGNPEPLDDELVVVPDYQALIKSLPTVKEMP